MTRPNAPELVSLHAPEVRTFAALELRDATESGQYIEGRAVPYNTWTDVGWFMEQFSPRAFAKSIKEAARSLPLLLWHDAQTYPVGVAHEWRDNELGLDVVWKMDTEDPRAVEAARKAREGYLTGLSVGFAPIPESDDLTIDADGLPWITRKEARLLEVSLTPTPAYAGAQVALVRSKQPQRETGRRRSSEIDAWNRYVEGIKR